MLFSFDFMEGKLKRRHFRPDIQRDGPKTVKCQIVVFCSTSVVAVITWQVSSFLHVDGWKEWKVVARRPRALADWESFSHQFWQPDKNATLESMNFERFTATFLRKFDKWMWSINWDSDLKSKPHDCHGWCTVRWWELMAASEIRMGMWVYKDLQKWEFWEN